MKIIFLDIDGVMNHQLFYKEEKEKNIDYSKETSQEYDSRQFDPRCMELLNHIIEKTGAKVVVSSSWRSGRTVEDLQDLLQGVGFKGEVIGKTPHLFFANKDYDKSVPRGCEIKAWLETNKGILGDKMTKVRYVILDDDSDMMYWQRESFLWVDSYCGLTPNITQKVILFLNR